MAFLVSPGVQVREFDISTIVREIANSSAGYVGAFDWGPVEEVTVIDSKARLQKYFGNPTDENALHWFSAANFLEYSNNLKLIRVVNDEIAKNATVAGHKAVENLKEQQKLASLDEKEEEYRQLVRNNAILTNKKQQADINVKIAQAASVVIEEELRVLQGELTTAEQAKNKTEGELTTLQGQETAKDQEILTATGELDVLKQALSDLQDELVVLKQDPVANATQITQKEQEISNKQNEIATKEAEIIAKKAEKAEIAKKVSAKQDEHDINVALFNEKNALVIAKTEKKDEVANTVAKYTAESQVIDDAKTKNDEALEKKKAEIDTAKKLLEAAEELVKDSTVYIKNQSNWTELYSNGNNGVGEFAAKYPSDLGSNIAVYMADSATYTSVSSVYITTDIFIYDLTDEGLAVTFTAPPTGHKDIAKGEIVLDKDNPDPKTGKYKIKEVKITNPGKNYKIAPDVELPAPLASPGIEVAKAYASLWKYANQFLSAPNTSNYVRERGGENDELHIVVVDETGAMTGVKGQVMERFANVSKAIDARYDDQSSAYYVAVLRDSSQYVWWMDHPEGMSNWGQPARDVSFKCLTESYGAKLGGGVAGSNREDITNSDLIRGWDEFSDTERVDVGILITGPADRILQNYILNIAERRMDCVAVLSPEFECVVKNTGNELHRLLDWRDVMPASSYGFADCQWKYQYDAYNDCYRWLPCNPDVAGLMARTDYDHDPWWSPAGFNRGHIKNAVKLAWNPGQTERDEMYVVGINPICRFLNEGIILYGDKTMLMKQSAFSRINVRRLFIVLEKSIATAAKYMLFEFNDDFTRLRFRQMVEPFLRDVKGRRGIYDFRVVCDESNNTPLRIDQNIFVGDIYIKPTRTINFIQLNFVAVATGTQFEEVIGTFGDF